MRSRPASAAANSTLVMWTIVSLRVSRGVAGRVPRALDNLPAPAGTLQARTPRTEILTAAFIPDAVEAMIALGRLADAGADDRKLERNGRRLDRAWMLALGARCRACCWPPGRPRGGESHGAAGNDRTSTGCQCRSNAPAPNSARPTPASTAPKGRRHSNIDARR